MKKTKRYILVFCVALMTILMFLVPFNAKMAEPDSRFGINAFILNRYNWEEWDRPIGLLKELGASWTREEFIWKQIEPEKGNFDWTFYDRAFGELTGSDINILGIIDYSAPWATEDSGREDADKYMPNISDWEDYVAALIDRYGDKVKYWQIWNEPNLPIFFKPEPNVAKYLELLKSASNVIRSRDREAKVILGGLSGVDVGYLEELRRLGAEEYFDILAVHPYRLDFNSPPEAGGLAKDLENAERIAEGFGGKDIWLTEFGWPTDNTEGVSEDIQADYLIRTYLMSFPYPSIKKLFWYDFRDDGYNRDYRENNFGLIDRSYRKKESFLAYQNLINILEHSDFERININGEGGIYDLFFKKNGLRIRTIWKVDGEGVISIGEAGTDISVYDHLGKKISSDGGKVRISGSPVFVISGISDAKENVTYNQTLEYEYVSQSPYIELAENGEEEAWLKIKNTGTSTWKNYGANPVVLGTCREKDRRSKFSASDSWLGSNRPARMQEKLIQSGETATFVFKIKSSNIGIGSYREYFCPLVEGVSWMRDIGIYWEVKVN